PHMAAGAGRISQPDPDHRHPADPAASPHLAESLMLLLPVRMSLRNSTPAINGLSSPATASGSAARLQANAPHNRPGTASPSARAPMTNRRVRRADVDRPESP